MLVSQMRGNLCKQSGFTNTRIAAEKHQRAAHNAAAKHGVKFINTAGYAVEFLITDLR